MIPLPGIRALGFRPLVFAVSLLAALSVTALPPATAGTPGGDRALAGQTQTTPPILDHSLMLIGCMGGLALGTVSVILPPVGGWVTAGVWMGGLGTMVVRAGFGCAYGSLAAAVASAARATVRWSEGRWRSWTTPPRPAPLPLEGASGS